MFVRARQRLVAALGRNLNDFLSACARGPSRVRRGPAARASELRIRVLVLWYLVHVPSARSIYDAVRAQHARAPRASARGPGCPADILSILAREPSFDSFEVMISSRSVTFSFLAIVFRFFPGGM